MTLIRRRPQLGELMALPNLMERFFDEPWSRRWFLTETPMPALDLRETPEGFEVKVALPGVEPKDVDLTLDGQLLILKGTFEKEVEEDETGWIHRELSRGSFMRSITLPMTAKTTDAKAVFKDGLLTLTIPKVESAKPIHVEVLAE